MALTEEEILDALETNLIGPKSVRVGDETVEARDADDFAKAMNLLTGQQAVAEGRSGFRFFQFKPPGAG
jgi:hypothetical protein